jgi:uncharacterized protein (DUF488 family)
VKRLEARMQVPATLWTIGHSTNALDALVGALRAHGVEAVADVRRYPASRRHPQFEATALARELPLAGLAYAPFRDLGGRRSARPGSRNTAWRNASFRGYADYMETADYAAALGRLCAIATNTRCVLMCAESLWWRCHRALIADDLKSRGTRVLHIGSDGGVGEHPYTGAARIVDGKLTYAAETAGLFGPQA